MDNKLYIIKKLLEYGGIRKTVKKIAKGESVTV